MCLCVGGWVPVWVTSGRRRRTKRGAKLIWRLDNFQLHTHSTIQKKQKKQLFHVFALSHMVGPVSRDQSTESAFVVFTCKVDSVSEGEYGVRHEALWFFPLDLSHLCLHHSYYRLIPRLSCQQEILPTLNKYMFLSKSCEWVLNGFQGSQFVATRLCPTGRQLVHSVTVSVKLFKL